MRHLRSAPGGLALLGWPRLLGAVAGLWLLPALAGVALVALDRLWPAHGLGLWPLALGTPLAVSPLFTGIGWLIALPVVAMTLHRGWFGWLPAAATGAVSGTIAGEVAGSEIAAAFGLVMLVLLRAVLGRMSPAAFTLPRAF